MLANDAIRRLTLSIIIVAGVGLVGHVFAAQPKPPDQTTADFPSAPTQAPAPTTNTGSGTATLTGSPGVIVNGAGSATLTLTGGTLRAGTNVYTGATTVSGGVLNFDTAVGTYVGTVTTVSDLGTLPEKPAMEPVPAVHGKGFYIITQGAGMGDNVRKLPFAGDETVLDAISQVSGLSQLSSKKIWIARPSASDPKKGTILPVDWDAITRQGINATNYPLAAGDRIFIAEDRLVALNNEVSKKLAPAERVLGFISLVESTLRGLLPQP
jgi:hypothetical protein